MPHNKKASYLVWNGFQEQLDSFGDLDEEDTESIHSVFYLLKQRFCDTHGKKQKKLIFQQFIFSGGKFICADINEINEGTTEQRI